MTAKEETGTAMVQFTGFLKKKPSPPRSRASSSCYPPLGRSSAEFFQNLFIFPTPWSVPRREVSR